MRLFKKTADIQRFLTDQAVENVGFVPTMGALHQGHLDLIRKSREQCAYTVASIFVNPTQFNNPADLEKYPRTIGADIRALEASSTDLLFLPEVSEIYPAGYRSPHYELGSLESLFEGAFRPGHFQGVCQVVDRLFEIVRPNRVFFGQKDYQQCMVIAKLLTARPAFHSIQMQIIPTRREADGLAMSSRNLRLSPAERQQAPAIYQTLQWIKTEIRPGNLLPLMEAAEQQLRSRGFRPEYISMADAQTLEPVNLWDGQQPLVALVAAFLGEIRLIDNLVL
ncbi:pantoate--beta-alanine ligase [Niabella terrae]